MISFIHKCIQVKVPKTAGTSIAAALGCIHIIKPHRDILEIKDAIDLARKNGGLSIQQSLPDDWFDTFFKFGFVRNPWDRVVSLYNRREGYRMSGLMTFAEFVEWIKHSSDTCIHPSRHNNQLDWFTDKRGSLMVDYIGKFETIESDWGRICDQLSIKIDLPHLRRNPANSKHYTEYYTKTTRNIIAKKFCTDIDYFGYSFGE